MSEKEKQALIRIVELILGACEKGFSKVPSAFRPKEVGENLSSARELLTMLKSGDFR